MYEILEASELIHCLRNSQTVSNVQEETNGHAMTSSSILLLLARVMGETTYGLEDWDLAVVPIVIW